MSRNISQYLANLNSLDPLDFVQPATGGQGRDGASRGTRAHRGSEISTNELNRNDLTGSHLAEDDLSIFSNTNFYDFDVGHSTNLAVTVDDLLMQQERQVQHVKKYPGYDGENPHANNGFSAYEQQVLERYSIANELAPYSNNQTGYSNGGSLTGPSTSTASPATISGHTTPFDMTLHTGILDLGLPSGTNSQSLVGGGNGLGASSSGSSGVGEVGYEGRAKFKGDGTYNGKATYNDKATYIEGAYKGPTYNGKVTTQDTADVATSERKRKAVEVEDVGEGEDENGETKTAADEDKRKRNTAASARFRIKKKLREQEMEREAQELRDKVQTMETKIMQLEMENKWLKNLVVERNEARDATDLDALRKRILGVTKGSDLAAKGDS